MRILVCVKRVLEADAALHIDPEGRVSMLGQPRFQLNRYDEFAVEEAVRFKETLPGIRVEAITVGPPEASSVLVRAGGMGVEHGIHVVVPDELEASRAEAVSTWIAEHARGRGYDLILCGVMSEDRMRGQVGPMVAELLDWPCATAIVAAELQPERRCVEVVRELEAGWRERLDLALPAVLTVQSGINLPRYPALSNLLRAKQRTWQVIDANGLPAPPPMLEIVGAERPARTRGGRVLEGDPLAKARSLVQVLAGRALLREPRDGQ